MTLQRSGVHSHEHIGEVARGVNTLTYMHLESGDTAKGALWSTDFCRIIGEGGNLVAHSSRYV